MFACLHHLLNFPPTVGLATSNKFPFVGMHGIWAPPNTIGLSKIKNQQTLVSTQFKPTQKLASTCSNFREGKPALREPPRQGLQYLQLKCQQLKGCRIYQIVYLKHCTKERCLLRGRNLPVFFLLSIWVLEAPDLKHVLTNVFTENGYRECIE